MKHRKFHPFFFACLLISLCVLQLHGQSTQTIRGRVVDEVDNTPLIGVNVVVMRTSESVHGSTTDVDGNYRIENVPVGRQTIKVTYIGYEEQTVANIVVTAGKEVVLNFTLRESVSQL